MLFAYQTLPYKDIYLGMVFVNMVDVGCLSFGWFVSLLGDVGYPVGGWWLTEVMLPFSSIDFMIWGKNWKGHTGGQTGLHI